MSAIDLATPIAGYEPEPWNVVRHDGVVVVHSVGIARADEACQYLNEHAQMRTFDGYMRRARYDVRPAPETAMH